MSDVRGPVSCLYCDKPNLSRRDRSAEHILPKSIGGSRTLGRCVCQRCNNGILSDLDRELCSRSHLSVVAAEELNRPLMGIYDVDYEDGWVLLDGERVDEGNAIHVYPQMILDGSQFGFRVDELYGQALKEEGAGNVFARQVWRAFKKRSFKAFHFEKMENAEKVLERYRYPPRIVARCIDPETLGNRLKFVISYAHDEEKKKLLSELESWKEPLIFGEPEISVGAYLGFSAITFEVEKVLRALAKISINLLASVCEKTEVSRRFFATVIDAITGRLPLEQGINPTGGFVAPRYFSTWASNGPFHTVRIAHDAGCWRFGFAFFGGRVCALAEINGPNEEDWRFMEITVPLNSPEWKFQSSVLHVPIHGIVDNVSGDTILPSVPLLNRQNFLRKVRG